MSRQAPYLQRRGYGLTFRIAVPPDLRSIVGACEITKALPTTNKIQALPMALEYAACAKRMFGELRTVMSVPDEKKLKLVLQQARLKIKLSDQFEEQDRREKEHSEQLRRVQLEADRRVADEKLKAENEVMRSVLKGRYASPMPTHPHAPESPPAASGGIPAPTSKPATLHRLSEAITKWKSFKSPAMSTVEIYEAAIKRFEARFPKLFAETIEEHHIREHVEQMLTLEKLSGKTIQKEHGAIRAILTIAISDGWIKENPASGTLLPKTKGLKVRSYTPEECKQIFDSSVFAAGERPIKGKGEAAYWMPLLLLFTGARREEISQLTTDRVRAYEGVHYLAIDAIDEEDELKTDESKRAVPIHAQLVKMGFLDFVEGRAKAGGGQLFAELKPNKRRQYGAKWGDWWRIYVRHEIGITDKRIHVAHSFRHLFISECRRLEFREDYERAIVGHVKGTRKDSHDGYGEHSVPSLAAAINRIDFRGLDLSHLWKH